MTNPKFIAFFNSPIGTLTIKATDSNLCIVHFNNFLDDDSKLVENPNLITQQTIDQLKQYFDGKIKQFNLPLYAKGTPFQQNVWNQLLKIEYGTTTSYLTQSKTFGNPKAIRAIANANGKNPIAIIIPCHRVIGSNGSLVGYAGELWRKQWLLQHEVKINGIVQTLF